MLESWNSLYTFLYTRGSYDACVVNVFRYVEFIRLTVFVLFKPATVKPVCNDHFYNKIYYLWFIQ